MCAALGLHLDCGSGRFDLTRLGVRSQHFPSSHEGHFLISIDSFASTGPTWQQLIDAGHVPKIQHDEIQCFELRSGVPVGKGARRARSHSSHVAAVQRPIGLKPIPSPSPPSSGHVVPSGCSTTQPTPGISGSSGSGANGSAIDGWRRGGLGLRAGTRAGVGCAGGDTASGSQISERDPLGRKHGESSPAEPSEGAGESSHLSSDTSRRAGDQANQAQQGQDIIDLQEGANPGSDRPQCGVSHIGHDGEPRCSLQHELDHPWSLDRAQVEATRLDGASEGCLGCRRPPLQAASALAGADVLSGSGGAVGAFGDHDQDPSRTTRAAADEVGSCSERRVAVTCRPWNRGQVQQLKRGINHVRQAMAQLALVAKHSEEPLWKVLEIFGGSANLSLVAKSTGKWIAIEPIDLVYGSDLLDPREQQLVFKQLDSWEPDLVCLEPPCGPWSSLQSLNPPETVNMKRALHMPFGTFSVQVWQRQHRAGRLVLLEQPLGSAALKLECMQKRDNVFRAVVDQCMFELKDPQNGKPYRKRTALDVNSELFAAALMKGALCVHDPGEHQTIEAQTLLDGKWVNRSLVAGTWTPRFAKHILSCAALTLANATCWQRRLQGACSSVVDAEEWENTSDPFILHTSFRAMTCTNTGCYEVGATWCDVCRSGWCSTCSPGHVCFPRDEVFADPDLLAYAVNTKEEADAADGWADHGAASEEMKTELAMKQVFRRLQREEEERKGDFSGIGSRFGYCKFVGPSLRVNQSVRNQVAKLHGNLGHPSNERLARMLKLQGARAEVVQAAWDLRCEICCRVHQPVSAPKTSASNPLRFNEHCSMDSFFFLDADGHRWNVTHIVDGFCALQYAILSKNPSSQTSCDLLFERWILVHGPMKELSVDGGPEFRGKFPFLCQLYGIHPHVLPTSSKWKAGLAERHGSILKLIILRMVHELVLNKEAHLRYALAMAIQAKNRLSRRCGKSPLQVVQGRDQVIPSSLLEQVDRGEIQYGTNSQLLESEEHAMMERMRQEAAAAFHWLDSHERLRMALNSRSRPPHLKADALPPGTTVYFFKQPGQAKRLQDFATGYQGPAIVACADGPERLWLRYKGSVVRVALENVRLATSEEEMGPNFILDALQSLEQELTGNKRAAGYEDESQIEADAPGSSDPLHGTLSETQLPSGTIGRDQGEGVLGSGGSASQAQEPPPSQPLQPMLPEATPEVIALAKESADRCRQLDGLPKKYRANPYEKAHQHTVPQKIAFFEGGDGDDTWRDILHEVSGKQKLPSGLQRLSAEKDLQHMVFKLMLDNETRMEKHP